MARTVPQTVVPRTASARYRLRYCIGLLIHNPKSKIQNRPAFLLDAGIIG